MTQLKITIKRAGHMEEGVPLHLFSAFCSAIIAQTVAMPADTLKTRSASERRGNNLKGLAERKDHNLALTVVKVPYSLDIGATIRDTLNPEPVYRGTSLIRTPPPHRTLH